MGQSSLTNSIRRRTHEKSRVVEPGAGQRAARCEDPEVVREYNAVTDEGQEAGSERGPRPVAAFCGWREFLPVLGHWDPVPWW